MTAEYVTEAAYIAMSLRDELAPWFGGYEDDFDMDAIYDEYEAALEARLEGMPGFAGLSWPADGSLTLWVNAYSAPEQVDALRQAIDAARRPGGEGGVDLEDIASRNELAR